MFEDSLQGKTLNLKMGDPREILFGKLNQEQKYSSSTFTYEMKKCQELEEVKFLMPINIFVGSDEELPGLLPN